MQRLAPAKINWSLAVTGRRADGYHTLDMLMQAVSLYDVLTFSPAPILSLTVEGNLPASTADNLVMRAAQALRTAVGYSGGAAIHLQKHIPIGAGLGGGSADASTTLKGLRDLWRLSISDAQLAEIGLRIGTDVPFCLQGGLARVTGIGEVISPIRLMHTYDLVILKPSDGLSTPTVFRTYDLMRPSAAHESMDAVQHALLQRDSRTLSLSMRNDLESAAIAMCPAIRKGKDALLEQGAQGAIMSGSGSAVFGFFPDADTAKQAASALSSIWPQCYCVRTV